MYYLIQSMFNTFTCNRCGGIYHKINTCKIRPEYWINKVYIDISGLDEESELESDYDEQMMLTLCMKIV